MRLYMQQTGFVAKKILLFVAFGILLIAALAVAFYFYLQYQKSQDMLKNPSANSQKEVTSLVEEVGRLIVLPQGEVPQVATVSDIEKLKNQQFFQQAKNGDKVLIYTKSQKAILYDPMQKKIVEVGPINLSQATPTLAPQPKSIKVALFNGSTTSGLTVKVEDLLKKSMTNVTVSEKANAKKSTYAKTLVIDTKGTLQSSVQQIAELLHGEVSTLPEGEEKPANTDIIVILGKQ